LPCSPPVVRSPSSFFTFFRRVCFSLTSPSPRLALFSSDPSTGRSGLDSTFGVIARLLRPGQSESRGLFLGDLVVHLLRNAGQAVASVLPELIKAMVQRIPTATYATFQQVSRAFVGISLKSLNAYSSSLPFRLLSHRVSSSPSPTSSTPSLTLPSPSSKPLPSKSPTLHLSRLSRSCLSRGPRTQRPSKDRGRFESALSRWRICCSTVNDLV